MDKVVKKYVVTKECVLKGAIWERGEDGLYRCEKVPHLALEEWQVNHDINHGYVKPLEYETNSSKET